MVVCVGKCNSRAWCSCRFQLRKFWIIESRVTADTAGMFLGELSSVCCPWVLRPSVLNKLPCRETVAVKRVKTRPAECCWCEWEQRGDGDSRNNLSFFKLCCLYFFFFGQDSVKSPPIGGNWKLGTDQICSLLMMNSQVGAFLEYLNCFENILPAFFSFIFYFLFVSSLFESD